jgi:hypothetical protein
MSDILIKGMEMPKNQFGTLLLIYPDGTVFCKDSESYKAIPISSHGRCIDADALLKGCKRVTTKYMTREYAFSQSAIENAPTILEAEEDE